MGCGNSSNPTASRTTAAINTSSGLPLPSSLPESQYQAKLYAFLGSFEYRQKGWPKDKRIRDTGPYKDGKYFGTHPAVKIYYSPEMIQWIAQEIGRASCRERV